MSILQHSTFKKSNLYGIIKFGKAKHIYDLYKHGNIYMQRVENFTKLEDSEVGDKNENLTHLFQSNKIKFLLINEKEIIPKNIVKIKTSNRKNPFVFCSYALDKSCFKNNVNKIDKRCLDFGDTVLFITDIDKFFERIQTKLLEDENLYHGLVEYIDERHYHGEMEIFKKFKYYSYQNEYRIVLDSSNHTKMDKLVFSIGSLEDISRIFPSKTFLQTLQVEA